MKPNISEFSYGYALTSELVRRYAFKGVGAPIFPSLKDEGSLGYDVKVPGVPLFLQFKLCDEMVRESAEDSDLLGVPHLRMHLRPLRHSDQHNLLRRLEARGNTVFYAAPEFTQPNDLNEAYDQGVVLSRTVLWSPGEIGLLDGGDHHIAFRAGDSFGYLRSEPRRMEKRPAKEILFRSVRKQVAAGRAHAPSREYFAALAAELAELYQHDHPYRVRERLGTATRDPQDDVAFVSQALFDCACLFVPVEDSVA